MCRCEMNTKGTTKDHQTACLPNQQRPPTQPPFNKIQQSSEKSAHGFFGAKLRPDFFLFKKFRLSVRFRGELGQKTRARWMLMPSFHLASHLVGWVCCFHMCGSGEGREGEFGYFFHLGITLVGWVRRVLPPQMTDVIIKRSFPPILPKRSSVTTRR